MKPWDKLLQSSIPEDIVLGVFLMDRAGELMESRISIPNNKETFTIDTDNFSCWTNNLRGGRVELSVWDVHIHSRWGKVNLHFDFRTK